MTTFSSGSSLGNSQYEKMIHALSYAEAINRSNYGVNLENSFDMSSDLNFKGDRQLNNVLLSEDYTYGDNLNTSGDEHLENYDLGIDNVYEYSGDLGSEDLEYLDHLNNENVENYDEHQLNYGDFEISHEYETVNNEVKEENIEFQNDLDSKSDNSDINYINEPLDAWSGGNRSYPSSYPTSTFQTPLIRSNAESLNHSPVSPRSNLNLGKVTGEQSSVKSFNSNQLSNEYENNNNSSNDENDIEKYLKTVDTSDESDLEDLHETIDRELILENNKIKSLDNKDLNQDKKFKKRVGRSLSAPHKTKKSTIKFSSNEPSLIQSTSTKPTDLKQNEIKKKKRKKRSQSISRPKSAYSFYDSGALSARLSARFGSLEELSNSLSRLDSKKTDKSSILNSKSARLSYSYSPSTSTGSKSARLSFVPQDFSSFNRYSKRYKVQDSSGYGVVSHTPRKSTVKILNDPLPKFKEVSSHYSRIIIPPEPSKVKIRNDPIPNYHKWIPSAYDGTHIITPPKKSTIKVRNDPLPNFSNIDPVVPTHKCLPPNTSKSKKKTTKQNSNSNTTKRFINERLSWDYIEPVVHKRTISHTPQKSKVKIFDDKSLYFRMRKVPNVVPSKIVTHKPLKKKLNLVMNHCYRDEIEKYQGVERIEL